MKKISVCLTLIVVLFLFSTFTVSAITGSLGNARMIISSDQYDELNDLNGKDYVIIEKTILVRNVNNVPLNITLIPDASAEEFIEMIDSNFILEPASGSVPTEKKARFNIRIKDYGGYDGKISVLFAPIGVDEPGVALSSAIVVNAKKDGVSVDPDLEDDSEDTGNGDDTPITGDAISSIPKGVMILGVSTLILLIVLIVLVYIMKKKKSKQNQDINIVKASEIRKDESKKEIEKKETKLDKKEVNYEKTRKPKQK